MVANTSANIPTTHIKTLNPTFRFEKPNKQSAWPVNLVLYNLVLFVLIIVVIIFIIFMFGEKRAAKQASNSERNKPSNNHNDYSFLHPHG